MKLDAIKFRFRLASSFVLGFVMLATASCSTPSVAPGGAPGRAFPEAEQLFHRDPRWLGADAALSVPLGRDRTLWLFGDTFVARSATLTRVESEMVRNTLALQTGPDPRSASITFHWRQESNGLPAAYFPARGERWYWPGHGIRLPDGPLLIFLYAMVATPGRDLGFAATGYAIAVIDDADAPVDSWRPRIVDAARGTIDVLPATAVIRDGAYIVALAIRQQGTHAGALVRYPVDRLAKGDLAGAEWWAGDARGWLAESALGAGGPAFVLDDAGAECSLHWDARQKRFVHIASYGFGASTIGMRTAPALTGPWSEPVVVYHPPESSAPRPFVYAAKAHPELAANDATELVVTYATNSFDFSDLFTPRGAPTLYWPRFVVVPVGQ